MHGGGDTLFYMNVSPGGVITAAWITALVVWIIGAFTTKATIRRQSIGSRLLEMSPLIVGYLLLRGTPSLLYWTSTRFVPPTFEWQVIGAVVTVAGVAIGIWARFYLGGNWSATVSVKQDHELIRTGPYAAVRHPIYSGLLLAILGTAIYAGEIRGLFALALAMVALKIKSMREEAFMQDEFGERYVQYRREVKSLVPFVW
jgi:protein-S-isoprenylcysteine O-methyltransferase Ste14